jgi:aspartate/methionine/tyrosine aminotransferase
VGWVAAYRHLLRPCLASAALHAPFVPTLSQQVALHALHSDPALFTPVRASFESRRRYTFERLQGLKLNAAWPAGGFFHWVPVWGLGQSGKQFADDLLRQHKVQVTPGELFGPSGHGHIRLSYAAEEGRLHEGLNRLARAVQQRQGSLPPAEARAA